VLSRRAALTLPLLLAGAGCAGGPAGTVRVAVPWSGWELATFRSVLREFRHGTGYDAEVVPLGDDIGAVLSSRRGGAVDAVLMPRIWAVSELADDLAPLDDAALAGDFPETWRRFLTPGDRMLGVPYKVAHKSVVWYRRDVFDRLGLAPPRNWGDWVQLNARTADAGVAPLALGAADGWVLCDFFENVLLGVDAELYAALAHREHRWQDPGVLTAFERLGDVWSQQGAFPRGAGGALLTQTEAAVVDDFLTGRAAMIAGADFTYPVIARHAAPDLERGWLDWFRFPLPTDAVRPPKVGGDVVVVPAPGTPGGLALASWLGTAEAGRAWARNGGFLSVHREVGVNAYPTDRIADLAVEVREQTARELVFDLADQLGAIGGGDGRGLWRVLQDFLRAVGDTPSRVHDAAERAAGRMAELAGGR
jgi:alpha-glucoside transport system substrate-binding protein